MLSNLIALIIGYVFSALCFIIIFTRLVSIYHRFRGWESDDYWMLSALTALVVRVVVIHLVLVDGTNNVRDPGKLSDEERRRREFGSKMILIGRTCYALFIWFMKFSIVSFYGRLVVQLEKYRVWLKYIWPLLGLTLAGVLCSTFLECRPFNHYWQVYPDPGEACNYSRVQLYTTGACNIFTDLILIIYPFPMIFDARLPLRRKLQIGGLFSLGFLVILVSIFRITFVVQNKALQQWRALFVSIEMLVACFVANAPALYRTIGVRVHSSLGTRSSGEGLQAGYLFTANQRRRTGGRGALTTLEEELEGSEGAAGGDLRNVYNAV